MYQHLLDKKARLAVVGLGYVGLPVALEFARKIPVIGFDINSRRIELMQKGIDPNKEVEADHFKDCDITFTDDEEILRTANVFIVAVPTPVDKYNVPDLKPLISACTLIGRVLKQGDYIVFESTTYPGCTEEDCVPVLEQLSGLKMGTGFKLGYSPERLNPGDKKNTLKTVVKVVSGCDAESLDEIAKIYELVVDAGVHRASSIKVAEASKIIENIQRDLNIALMNELSLIFDRMGINTFEVIEAAGTKWNFLKFHPGLVGGHCISVDPYYLTYKAASLGYESKVITASRFINDDMAKYVARKIITHVLRNSNEPKVLVKGVTFKENVSDIRNSKIIDTVKELLAFNFQVDVEDPYAGTDEVYEEYGLHLTRKAANDYDAVIVTVPHAPYMSLTDEDFASITRPHAIVADLKGIYKNKITSRNYWSL
ncbi:nucleotide sugar dehydrogenase [Pseudobacter ginsenosidimutans]|uniref:UDP-N-acetyl-D-galactosamine dehydrogenase n=1 Tax=Pseudobacter ginsenosidimutans TaxID=661488 RepID=A0A4Q7MN17_9BACT|nr:nucleotide sugar dehydrogenase [Pseudobacter ginsenosidimutans]QEC40323.1 nucleotide sugar dehydrogenase [Pseudobacter ginsenosidimutans]RZS69073.1 UDP-N-acetyl-D-galactosamine dehydrogenase [Pseudobacter ginsenosidimutans]